MNHDTLRTMARTLLEAHGVDAGGAEPLASTLAGCFERTLAHGEVLCREGEPAAEMWVLTHGAVRVLKKDYLGAERELVTLRAPAMLGHMALVARAPRSATCVAVGEARVAVVDQGRFQALERDASPPGDIFRRLIIAAMTRQLHRGNAELRRIVRGEDGLEDAATEEVAPDVLRATATFDGWS